MIEKQGWKVFDLTEKEHVHASKLLGKLTEREYRDLDEVIDALIAEAAMDKGKASFMTFHRYRIEVEREQRNTSIELSAPFLLLWILSDSIKKTKLVNIFQSLMVQ